MTFQVESGIDLPRLARGRRATEFPLTEMDVGDSFLIPFDVTDGKLVDSWRRKVAAAKKKVQGGEFRTATMSDGLRVWRTH
jgi:hypothetical protein